MVIVKEVSKDKLLWLPDICRIFPFNWFPNEKRGFVYWVDVLSYITSKSNIKCNIRYVALDDDHLVGWALFFDPSKKPSSNALQTILHYICIFVLLFTKHGRFMMQERQKLRKYFKEVTFRGIQLLGCSTFCEGAFIVIDEAYRQQRIYTQIMKEALSKMSGTFIFLTNSECTFEAHKKAGFKTILEISSPQDIEYIVGKTTMIMYKEL